MIGKSTKFMNLSVWSNICYSDPNGLKIKFQKISYRDWNRGLMKIKPKMGPRPKGRSQYWGDNQEVNPLNNWMLAMVMANPIQLAMVKAEPISSLGAYCAFRVKNCGESPTTTIPQKIRNSNNTGRGAKKNNGDNRQQMPDAESCHIRLPRASCPKRFP